MAETLKSIKEIQARLISLTKEKIDISKDLVGDARAKKLKSNLNETGIAKTSIRRLKTQVLQLLNSTFADRTQSMLKSLCSINEKLNTTDLDIAFLIAGADHLKTPEWYKEDSRRSLVHLYKTLESYPAVILIPKLVNKLLYSANFTQTVRKTRKK